MTAVGGWKLLAILALAGFVTSFGAHVVAVNLPSYAQMTGIGAFMIGVLIAVYDAAELIAKPVAGYVADRRGLKMMLLAGLATFVAGSFLFLVIDSRGLLVVRLLQGLGAAALSTISITLVARHFADRRGSAFGWYNAIKGAGYVLAPSMGGFLVARQGFDSIFVACAALGVIVLLLSLAVPSDRTGKIDDDDDDDEPSLRDFLAIFVERRLLGAYGTIFINMLLVGILFGFLPVYLHGLGYDPFHSGLIVTAATASYLVIQPIAGRLADRVPIAHTITAGLALASITIGAITFLSGTALIVAVVAAGIGVGIVWTNTDALVSSLSDERRLAASMGAAQSFKEAGDMAGPLLVGGLTQAFGIRVGFVTCAAFALFCLVLLIASRGSGSSPSATRT